MNRRDLVIAGLLALGAFAVYLVTLAPDMLPGDGGEFQLAVPLLGIVHPTGYPLYLLLGKLFTLLPFGNAAYSVSLFSAATAALAVGAFYLAGISMADLVPARWIASGQFVRAGDSSGPRVIAAGSIGPRSIAWESTVTPTARSRFLSLAVVAISLGLAFSPTLWSQATVAEVYALNAVFVITLLGMSMWLRESPSFYGNTNGARWQWLALVLGLSLAHHRTIILLVPVLAVYLFPYMGLRAVWKRALILGALPLLLYFYSPLRYDASPYLQTRLDDSHAIVSLARTPEALLSHALGIGFRGALRWDDRSIARLVGTIPRIADEFTLVGVLFSLLGIAALVHARRGSLLFLLLGTACAYTLFNAVYQIGDIADFYTPLYIMTAFLMVAGAAWLAQLLFSRRLHWVFVTLLFALSMVLFFGNFDAVRGHHDTPVRAHWQSLLVASLPAGSVLVSNDRDEMTPLLYLQSVEGLRRDVAGLYPLISGDTRLAHVVSLTQYALETARPVYLIKPMEGLSIKFRVQPEGPWVRVLGIQDGHPQTGLERDSAIVGLLGWSSSATAVRRDPLVISLYWQPLGTARPDLKTYVHLDSAEGKTLAHSDHTPGGPFYPPSEWQPADTLRDAHTLILPNDFPAGVYQLVAGAYLPDGQSIDGVGHIELGPITVSP